MSGTMTTKTWTISDEIAFFEKYGRMRYPLQGGENPPLPEGATLSEDGKKFTWNGQTFLVQSEVNALVGNARTEGKTKGKEEADAELARQAANATEEELKEQGKFKTLYEQSQTRIADLEGKVTQAQNDLATERLTAIRTKVATEHKLPPSLADRLKGATEEELKADAVELAKTVQPVKAPDTQNNGTNNSANQNTNNGGTNNQGGGNEGAGNQNQRQTPPKQPYAFQTPGEVSW